eukprot:scaffold5546_cov65-Phaeocystis_antarctica.AAC.4
MCVARGGADAQHLIIITRVKARSPSRSAPKARDKTICSCHCIVRRKRPLPLPWPPPAQPRSPPSSQIGWAKPALSLALAARAAAARTAAPHPARASGGGSRCSSREAAAAAAPPRQPGEARPGDYPRTPAHRSRAERVGWPCRSLWRPRPSHPASRPSTACP